MILKTSTNTQDNLALSVTKDGLTKVEEDGLGSST